MVRRLLLICVIALAAACVSPVGPREPVRFDSAARPAGSSSFPNWHEPPDVDLGGINNAPRKELAAYAIQRLFLDPEDYVVPATTVRCMPLEQWEAHHGSTEPTIPGTRCVLVVVALWLQDVALPDVLFDRERFLTEPGPPQDADTGATLRGTTVQFGLTTREIDAVWDRIQELIRQVDAGDLPVF